jgi:hypothetical protein
MSRGRPSLHRAVSYVLNNKDSFVSEETRQQVLGPPHRLQAEHHRAQPAIEPDAAYRL